MSSDNIDKEENIRVVATTDDDVATDEPVITENIKPRYCVMSIEETTAPEGMSGDNWYEYVIGEGTSKIQGLKIGSLAEVTQHANKVTDDLNDRSKSKKTGYSQIQNKKTAPVKTS